MLKCPGVTKVLIKCPGVTKLLLKCPGVNSCHLTQFMPPHVILTSDHSHEYSRFMRPNPKFFQCRVGTVARAIKACRQHYAHVFGVLSLPVVKIYKYKVVDSKNDARATGRAKPPPPPLWASVASHSPPVRGGESPPGCTRVIFTINNLVL